MKHADTWMRLITIFVVILYTLLSTAMVVFKINNTFIRIIALTVLASALYLAIDRNTYLPFLGETAISPIVFDQELAPPGSSTTYELKLDGVEDSTRVLYWASMTNEGDHYESPEEAYQGFANTGITSVKNGQATLKLNCPDTYDVGLFFKRTLDKHIHYRLIKKNNAMMSQVYTVYISC